MTTINLGRNRRYPPGMEPLILRVKYSCGHIYAVKASDRATDADIAELGAEATQKVCAGCARWPVRER